MLPIICIRALATACQPQAGKRLACTGHYDDAAIMHACMTGAGQQALKQLSPSLHGSADTFLLGNVPLCMLG